MHTITVHWTRLESGLFTPESGDIAAASSANTLPKVQTFMHAGTLWTCMGVAGNVFASCATCYPLIPKSAYRGPENVPQSHEGKHVVSARIEYRLGPKTAFVGTERTVEEFRTYFRAMYREGGYFTAGKTYHETIRELAAVEQWNTTTKDFEPIKGNAVEAIALELQQPDFTKHGTDNEPAAEVKPQLELELV